jgi:large subunit ribosomal protein L17
MFRNMVTSLLEHERIYTTDAKAKELRRWADWMITLGKRGDLHARRQALQVIRDKSVVHKLFTDLAQRYQARSGGYTRAVKVGVRPGDCAPISLVELMTGETAKKKRKKKRKAPKAEEAARAKAEVAAEAEGTEALQEEEAVAAEAPEKPKKTKRKTAKKPEAEAPAEEETLKPEPETAETSKGEPEKTVEEAAEPAAKKKDKTDKGKKKSDKA